MRQAQSKYVLDRVFCVGALRKYYFRQLPRSDSAGKTLRQNCIILSGDSPEERPELNLTAPIEDEVLACYGDMTLVLAGCIRLPAMSSRIPYTCLLRYAPDAGACFKHAVGARLSIYVHIAGSDDMLRIAPNNLIVIAPNYISGGPLYIGFPV